MKGVDCGVVVGAAIVVLSLGFSTYFNVLGRNFGGWFKRGGISEG